MSEKSEKKAKRLKEFIAWVDNYKILLKRTVDQDVVFIENAAQILNGIYWTLIDDYIRPLVKNGEEDVNTDGENNVSRFKIISATELAIIQVQPIKGLDERIERSANAVFAYWVAMLILRGFTPTFSENTIEFIENYKEDIAGVEKDQLQSIQEDHLMWLELIDPVLALPIISNAQTWRLYNLALNALEQKVKYGGS